MARTPNKVLSAKNAHEMPVEERRRMEYLQTSPVRRLSIRPVGSPPRQEAAHRLARMRRVVFRRSRLANGLCIDPPLEVKVLRGLMRRIEGIDVTPMIEATHVAVEAPSPPPSPPPEGPPVVDFVEIA